MTRSKPKRKFLPATTVWAYAILAGFVLLCAGWGLSGHTPAGRMKHALDATVAVEAGGLCSGVVARSDGLILTNAHCMAADTETVIVRWRDGTARKGFVLMRDENADVALVLVYGTGLAAVTLDCSLTVDVGDDVYAVGHPNGLTWTVTRGIVSAIGRDGKWLQVDALIWFGNSGGPLLDRWGRLVGLNNAVAAGRTPFGAQITGHGFAVDLATICAALTGSGYKLS